MSRVTIDIERTINAPAEAVSRYISDFENACEWMVGIEEVRRISEVGYRLAIETPVGLLEPEADVVEARPESIRWVYTSVVDGSGAVSVMESAGGAGCTVFYRGDFHLRGRILGRAAKAVGMEGFVRRQGERSLERLRQLMEAGRFGGVRA